MLDACSSQEGNNATDVIGSEIGSEEESFLQELSESDYSMSEGSDVWGNFQRQEETSPSITAERGGPHFVDEIIFDDLARLADMW